LKFGTRCNLAALLRRGREHALFSSAARDAIRRDGGDASDDDSATDDDGGARRGGGDDRRAAPPPRGDGGARGRAMLAAHRAVWLRGRLREHGGHHLAPPLPRGRGDGAAAPRDDESDADAMTTAYLATPAMMNGGGACRATRVVTHGNHSSATRPRLRDARHGPETTNALVELLLSRRRREREHRVARVIQRAARRFLARLRMRRRAKAWHAQVSERPLDWRERRKRGGKTRPHRCRAEQASQALADSPLTTHQKTNTARRCRARRRTGAWRRRSKGSVRRS